jgi:glycosyltransferase involved in cell wall biosynthesis
MTKLPTVSIIIPAYNEEKVIEKCVLSCVHQSDPADEIIVINNNSSDDTATIVRKLQKQHSAANIRLLTQKEKGLVPTRNHGFKMAKGDIMGRIDADSAISEDWVYHVRRTFSDPEVMAATGPVVYNDMPLPKVGLAIDGRIRKALHNSAKDHTFVFGSNMAIRKSAWAQIQDLIHRDEEDRLHEDIDIALSLFRKNLKVAYDENMIGGMSARRLEDRPREFYSYVMRFERTFRVHGIRSTSARIPIFIYLMIYFPTRTLRKFYDGDTSKFTLQKLRDDLVDIREHILRRRDRETDEVEREIEKL